MKNILLIATYFLSFVPVFLKNTNVSMYMSLLKARAEPTPLSYISLYYSTAINFMILAYCLHYPKGVKKIITRFILIVTLLDFVHLFLYAKQGFELEKLITAFTILLIYTWLKQKR